MLALSALTLTTFDANLLAAALGTLTHLTLLADILPYASFDDFLAASARPRLTHLRLPHFDGVPPPPRSTGCALRRGATPCRARQQSWPRRCVRSLARGAGGARSVSRGDFR
ncbi:hypothetical protein EDB85DRAFT_1973129 [Lactarius pseudohatsudake]|nr:hypothetical protein EDB85DRAFT_1973129 [Lactarius pseudohatsudake]